MRTRTVTTCGSLGLLSTVTACDQRFARLLETERRDATTTPYPCSGSSLTRNFTTQQNINLPACPSRSFCEAAYAVCCVNCPLAGTTAGQWGAWSASRGYATRTRVDYVCAAVPQAYYSGCQVVCQNVNVYDNRSIAAPSCLTHRTPRTPHLLHHIHHLLLQTPLTLIRSINTGVKPAECLS